MDSINNIDLRDALKNIALRNTYFNLDNDLGISIEQIERAAKLDDPAEKTLIWVSHPSGIDCYTEREVFQKNASSYKGVLRHEFNMQGDYKLAYAVLVTAMKDGKAYGNLYEMDLQSYAAIVQKKALPSKNVRIYSKHPRNYGEQIVMPKKEFERRYPADLPPMSYWRNEPNNPAALHALLDDISKEREANCKPCDLWLHINDQHDKRLAFYSNQIMQNLNELDMPNTPDGQNFSIILNPNTIVAFPPEQCYQLMNTLPYENIEFSIKKGQRGLRAVVPRDEVLKERQGERGKPSILTQLQEAKESAARSADPPKIAAKHDTNREV